MKSGDVNRVMQPLHDFWTSNPDYRPNHLGRCYPHGHPEIRDLKGTVACQVDTLQRVAGMLIVAVDPTAASSQTAGEEMRSGSEMAPPDSDLKR